MKVAIIAVYLVLLLLSFLGVVICHLAAHKFRVHPLQLTWRHWCWYIGSLFLRIARTP